MLMAAITSTSPGSDTANHRTASFERPETAGISFAESFDEESATAGATALPLADQIKPAAAVESKASPSGEGIALTTAGQVAKAKQDADIVGKTQVGLAKILPEKPELKKTASPHPSKTSTIAVVPRSTKKSVEAADTKAQPEVSNTQSTFVASRGEKKDTQQLEVAPPDAGTSNGTDLDPDVAATSSAKPPVAGNIIQQVPGEKNESVGADKSQDANSAPRPASAHETAKKEGSVSKSISKPDQTVGTGQPVAGVAGQSLVCVPAFLDPGTRQANAETPSDADPLSPVLSSSSGRSAGIVMAATPKGSKEIASGNKPDADKPEDDKVKTSVSVATDGTAAPKADVEAAKPGSVSTSTADEDKTKGQSVVSVTTAASPLHTVTGSTESGAGNISGRVLPHDAGVTQPMSDAISHVASTVHTGSNPSDTIMAADMAHKTWTATPTSLEVGVSNGTHGWLKIRAEMADGGAINTSLSPSSSSGSEMLHRELPSLTAYLHNEHVAVNAVVVQPAAAAGIDLRPSFGAAGGSEHGQAPQSGGQGRERQQDAASRTPAPAGTGAAYRSVATEDALPSVSYAGGGGWLSVRA